MEAQQVSPYYFPLLPSFHYCYYLVLLLICFYNPVHHILYMPYKYRIYLYMMFL